MWLRLIALSSNSISRPESALHCHGSQYFIEDVEFVRHLPARAVVPLLAAHALDGTRYRLHGVRSASGPISAEPVQMDAAILQVVRSPRAFLRRVAT